MRIPACEVSQCINLATYGNPRARIPIRCSEHKENHMVIINTKWCEHEKCEKTATWGVTKSNLSHCEMHKRSGMVRHLSGRCCHNSCEIHAAFGFENDKPKFCRKHALPNMINVFTAKYNKIQKKPVFITVPVLSGLRKQQSTPIRDHIDLCDSDIPNSEMGHGFWNAHSVCNTQVEKMIMPNPVSTSTIMLERSSSMASEHSYPYFCKPTMTENHSIQIESTNQETEPSPPRSSSIAATPLYVGNSSPDTLPIDQLQQNSITNEQLQSFAQTFASMSGQITCNKTTSTQNQSANDMDEDDSDEETSFPLPRCIEPGCMHSALYSTFNIKKITHCLDHMCIYY